MDIIYEGYTRKIVHQNYHDIFKVMLIDGYAYYRSRVVTDQKYWHRYTTTYVDSKKVSENLFISIAITGFSIKNFRRMLAFILTQVPTKPIQVFRNSDNLASWRQNRRGCIFDGTNELLVSRGVGLDQLMRYVKSKLHQPMPITARENMHLFLTLGIFEQFGTVQKASPKLLLTAPE